MNQPDGEPDFSPVESTEGRRAAGASVGHTESRGLLSHVATSSRPNDPNVAPRKASVPYEAPKSGAIPAFRLSQQQPISHWDSVRDHLNQRVIATSAHCASDFTCRLKYLVCAA